MRARQFCHERFREMWVVLVIDLVVLWVGRDSNAVPFRFVLQFAWPALNCSPLRPVLLEDVCLSILHVRFRVGAVLKQSVSTPKN